MDWTPETPQKLEALWLGREEFDLALQRQLRVRDSIVDGSRSPTLFLVEHPSTLTLGRRGERSDILWGEEELQSRSIRVHESPRGGEVTLHAPGQLVAYPVVKVGRKIREHIHQLADATIELLESFGIRGGEFRMEHPGVWIGQAKVASIGIHVSRGITVQGISINVDVDPSLYGSLVSCGISGVDMASMSRWKPEGLPGLDVLAVQWAELYAKRCGYQLHWASTPEGE